MTHFKTLFLDIDGTIIKPDDQIESSTKQAILQVQQQGIEVFLATGRPIHEIRELGDELQVSSYIGYNGALGIYRGKELFQEPMEPHTVANFFEIARDHQHEVVMYTDSANAFTSLHNPSVENFIKQFHLYKNELYSPDILNTVLGMTLINLKEDDPLFYQNQAGVHLSQVNIAGMHHCYDVIQDSVNKGVGIKRVLQHLGFSERSAIAFGDGLNDKEMLQSVGASFAMGNAHPDLFSYAIYKTTDVNHSGVYNGLKQLGLVE